MLHLKVRTFIDIQNHGGLNYHLIVHQNCDSLLQQNLGLISDKSYTLNT